jgi:hypothetical protein
MTRGRCYDHNFLRFSPIFGEIIGVFLKYQCYYYFFSKFSFVLSQKTPIFSLNFLAKIFKKSLHRSQIGRIFADWEIVHLLLESLKSYIISPYLGTAVLSFPNLGINFDQKWVGLHFGRIFLKLIWSPCLPE